MKLPKRIEQHISETASYKIFSSKIPDNWIIRDITERDYGIDCYIELVNKDNDITGNLISIQLKAKQGIKWTQSMPVRWTLSGVDIGTTNYWYNFSVPVFICLVDLVTSEVFFQSVSQYIKNNYFEYSKQASFSYKFDKNNLLGGHNGLLNFLQQYFRDKRRSEFEQNVITYFAHYSQYKDFILDNTNRDIFLGVETSRVLFAKHFYNNLRFLSDYLGINWDLSSFNSYEKISQSRFGDDYDLYEQQLDEILNRLEKKLIPILIKLKELITKVESEYWMLYEMKLYNFVSNADENGEFADW
ncbi:DUF4365 domain-containing protein [Pontibacter sp. FD36]|uniref:DUF4365 domain-containing protein n=1 Tax=Pontibacter sp. FD36 TaxID=2789860 RepID=UPI0018ABAE72|nr:DUF4365 domain-containing protein [Pontibacter sp. FD36]MBF8965457.1 DUF4365 domain-containing protein [Pontibacter sp. FD36]